MKQLSQEVAKLRNREQNLSAENQILKSKLMNAEGRSSAHSSQQNLLY